jgi:hypothetical protein
MTTFLGSAPFHNTPLTDEEWERRFDDMLKATARRRGTVYKERDAWVAFDCSGQIRLCNSWLAAIAHAFRRQ